MSSLSSQPKAKPRIIVLAASMPPSNSGSAAVLSSLARQFDRSEMVIIGTYTPGQPKLAWDAKWPKRIIASIQVPHHWRGKRFLQMIQWPIYLMVAVIMFFTNRCNCILAVYPSPLSLWTGYVLHRITRKPFFPYLHNTLLERKNTKPFTAWLQPRVFQHAAHVYVISDGMKMLYEETYPNLSISSLKHTVSESIPSPDSVRLPPVHDPFRLASAGNIDGSCGEAATRFGEAITSQEDLELAVYPGARTTSSKLVACGFHGPRVTVEKVSHDDLFDHLANAMR